MSGKIRKRPTPPEFITRHIPGVPLTFLNEAGEPVKEEFTLEVKSFTEFGWGKVAAELEAEPTPDGILPFSALFPKLVTAIIDNDGEALTEEDGTPAQLTRQFFASLVPEDLKAIDAAIRADANPPKPSSPSGSSGSNPAASEG